MTTRIHMIDRDQYLALQRAAHDTLEPGEPASPDEIATMRAEVQAAREQLSRLEAELDALALGGHIQE